MPDNFHNRRLQTNITLTKYGHTFRTGGSQMTLYVKQRSHLLGYLL